MAVKKLTPEQRAADFKRYFQNIPGEDVGQKLDWLVDNLGVTRTTAKIWNTKATERPIPQTKLELLVLKLRAAGVLK